MIDTEDKLAWCERGLLLEREFVSRYYDDLCVEINPAKLLDKYAPDLLVAGAVPGDLKVQDTAFRTAGRYGVPADRAVTFNEKDYDRYSEKYPAMLVFFWVRFLPGEAVFLMTMSDARRLCLPERRHHYLRRKHDDRGNAKTSYVLDIRTLRRVA